MNSKIITKSSNKEIINNRAALLGFEKSYAFVIGVNEYPHLDDNLKTAVPDAQKFAYILANVQGFDYVELLENPTKQIFDDLLDRLLDSSRAPFITKKDSIVFYYAGHGKPGHVDGGPAGYLLPSDAKPNRAKLENHTLVDMSKLFLTLKTLECHHTLLILDCCFAGSFKKAAATSRKTVDLTLIPLYEERFNRYISKKAMQILVSSGPTEVAADWMGDRDEKTGELHSPFAKALFEALEGNAELKPAGKNLGDGVLTSHELWSYLWNHIETKTKLDPKFTTQHPDLFEMGFDDGGEFIFLDPKNRLNFAERNARNPYPGLKPFAGEDSDLFFGRKGPVKEVLTKLQKAPILIISAPSGFGKTSFIQAGVYPALQEKEGFELSVFTPDAMPHKKWKEFDFKIDHEKNQLIVFDQFERLYTECSDAKEREDFERVICDLWLDSRKPTLSTETQPKSKLRIIIAIRSDFEWQLLESSIPRFMWSPQEGHKFFFRLPPMVLDELREALVHPALVETYDFESEELINLILQEVSYAPGALPLLSFAMHLMVEMTDEQIRMFTLDNYKNKLKGVSGALSKRADDIYESLEDESFKNTMRHIMLRMVDLKDGTYIGKNVPIKTVKEKGYLNELDYPLDIQDERVNLILGKLSDAGLISYAINHIGQPCVKPIHDALINYWPTCLKWIKDFGDENIVLQRQLWESVSERLRYGGKLWSDNPKLQELHDLSQKEAHWLNELELSFVLQSWQENQNQIENLKRQRDEALSSAYAAQAMLNFPENNRLGLELAFKAYQTFASEESATALHDISSNRKLVLSQMHSNPTYSITLPSEALAMTTNRFGTLIFTSHTDQKIRVWGDDKSAPVKVIEIPGEAIHLTCSKNEKYLHASCSNGESYVIHFKSDLVIHLDNTGMTKIGKGAFSENNAELLAIVNDTILAVWNPESGDPIHGLTSDETEDKMLCASSDSGGNYWAFYDGPYRIKWNTDGSFLSKRKYFIEKKQLFQEYIATNVTIAKDKEIVSMDVNTDLSMIVYSDNHGSVFLREIEGESMDNYYEPTQLLGLEHIVSVQFTEEDRFILGIAEDNLIGLWDVDSKKLTYKFNKDQSPLIKQAVCSYLSKEGTWVIENCAGGIMNGWKLPLKQEYFTPYETCISFIGESTEKSELIVATEYKFCLINALDFSTISEYEYKTQGILAVAFHRNYLATFQSGGWVVLYDKKGKKIKEYYTGLVGDVQTKLVFVMDELFIYHHYKHYDTLSVPDLKRINSVLITKDKSAFCPTQALHQFSLNFLDQFTDGKVISDRSLIMKMIPSPDYKYMIFMRSKSHAIEIWSVARQELYHTFDHQNGQVAAIVFDPFGYLISTTLDGVTCIWDIENKFLLTTIKTSSGMSVNVSYDGSKILIGSLEGEIDIKDHLLAQQHIQAYGDRRRLEDHLKEHYSKQTKNLMPNFMF